ncbi:hypothetical protein [Bradyrhizobium sp. CCBAU 11361]|uniref:hypothetical protein n=1 Tax=Bradyrhizobium sp. CCBAU 11361 TaxID=1630812 RepID=UPI002302986A|nr:hypothetical protein [Bradyrhizobium sp. CCBAU 11361]MDA9488281.1 hypothetical protein [Bradyrhizobium sp. CCBAU 11361]
MNAARQSANLHVISSEEKTATRRLHVLMRQREVLRPAFRSTWDVLSHHFEPYELEAWAAVVLALAHVNAGPACLIAYWDASTLAAPREEIAPLLASAQSAVEICRSAGAQAATAALKSLPIANRNFGDGPALARWWRAMEALSQRAPESVGMVAGRLAEILAPGTIDAFEDFVASGLRASSGNRARPDGNEERQLIGRGGS